MGFSLSWAAVRGKSTASVYAQLDVQGTGIREEFPESPIVGAILPGGWTLVMVGRDGRMVDDAVLQPLSAGCEVVACFVEEHVMVSTAAGWKDGRKIWSVSHDAQQDIEHLDAKGDLPPIFTSIRDRLGSEQLTAGGKHADVDCIFDVPVELAAVLTGFRHDVDIPDVGDSLFEVLISTLPKSERKSWIMRLIGR